MIYSFHHHMSWVKGGVETGMAYRAKIFRSLGLDAKFVFATTFPGYNIWDETNKLGFFASEVLWLYGFFSDCHPSPVIYTLEQLEKTLEGNYVFSRQGSLAKYQFPDRNAYYNVFLMGESSNLVGCVEVISNACLVRKDYGVSQKMG